MNQRRKEEKKLTSTHQMRQNLNNAILIPLKCPVNLIHHFLEILGLQITQDLRCGAFDLFDVVHGTGAARVDCMDALTDIFPALVVFFCESIYGLLDFVDAVEEGCEVVVDHLDAVVEIGELLLLGADGVCGYVVDYLGEAVF